MRYSMVVEEEEEEEGGGSRLMMLVNYGTATSTVTRVPYRHDTGSHHEFGKAGTYARSTGAGRPRGNCGRLRNFFFFPFFFFAIE